MSLPREPQKHDDPQTGPPLDFQTRAHVLAATTPLHSRIAGLEMANRALREALARAEAKLTRRGNSDEA